MPDRQFQHGHGSICSLTGLAAATLVCCSFGLRAADPLDDRPVRNSIQETAKPALSVGVQNSHLGYTFFHTGGTRYFVTEIVLTNQSNEDLTLPMFPIMLLCDGVAFDPDIEHPKLAGHEFRTGGETHRFSTLPQTKVLPIPAGATRSAWLVYTELPKTPDVPELELRFGLDNTTYALDIDAHYDARLALDVQRIGPRGALGLLTIQGTLNTINIGALVDALDELTSEHVSRAVVCFSETATDVDDSIANWLRERAGGNQTNRNYPGYPAIVSTIREFHLAEIPTHGSSGRSSGPEHESTAAAVESALATAYGGLPAEEIVEQIQSGHRLVQASALACGGTELPAQHLPLLLERTVSDDRLLRRGAYIALGGLGEPDAIDALGRGALSDDEETALIAVECLAASRYVSAHERLKSLLEESLPVSGTDLVRILARHPRRQWSEYLSRLARDERATADPSVRQEALRALGRIGHPDLTEILAEALADEAVRDIAFHLLLIQDDDASERLAIEHALRRLQAGPPTTPMLQLFDRVRDPRIAPMLMSHLDNEKSDRTALINTLARVGTAGIDRVMAERYKSLKANEQAVVLTCLMQLRSAELFPLARAAVQSEHDAVFRSASRTLSLVADNESTEILAAQLQREQQDARIKTLAKSLEEIGTQQAARALATLKQSSTGGKRETIASHLRNWQLKSPGGQHLERADRYMRQGDYEKAIEHYTLALKHDAELAPAYTGRGDCRRILEDYEEASADYSLALEWDPELSQAYSGRGHCRLKLEDFKQAADDFRQGAQLNPDDGQAVTGLGIALAMLGEIDEGIRIVNEAEEHFANDDVFAYNAACVYGRALEHIPQDTPSEQQQGLREEYADAAIARLERSIELGFQDLDWMQADPDLVSLHGFDRFQNLLRPQSDPERPPEVDSKDSPPADKIKARPEKDVIEP